MTKTQEPLVIGIDVGGTKILSAVVDIEGTILSSDYTPTPAKEDHHTGIASIIESVQRSLNQAGIPLSNISAIGLGIPGISNPSSGILFASPHLPQWSNVPIRDLIHDETGTNTFLVNDANAAAVGELTWGAARGASDFLYVTISTGIGGGIIINGELYTGCCGTAGEIGHMTIDDSGLPCNCGNRGCWETLASGTALARSAKERLMEGAESSILRHAGGSMENVTAPVIHSAALEGDELARQLIEQTGYYVGVGLVNLIDIFNPECIVIGGGLTQIGDMLLIPAFNVVKERAYKENIRTLRLLKAELGINSGVLGAAAYALKQLQTC